jgi:hypothetical protein
VTADDGRSRESAPGIDTARTMKEIKAVVAAKKASGAYTDEELAAIAGMELRLQEREEYGAEMDRLISWLHAHWEATGPVDTETGMAGSPARGVLKKALRVLLSPLSRLLLSKQNQINARVVQLFSGSLPPLRESSRDVEKRMENLALRLEKENAGLRESVQDLSARLELLEGSRRDGESRRGER